MTDFGKRPEDGDGRAGAKAPPPDLDMRAPRPAAVRMRRSAVRIAAGAGAAMLAGSLAWAFVVQPELREAARLRQIEARDETSGRAVRPAEIVTDQPDRYDRLPEPRGAEKDADAGEGPTGGATSAPRPSAYRPRSSRSPAVPGAGAQARASGLFFAADADARGPSPETSASGLRPAARPPAWNPHDLAGPVSPYEVKAGALVPALLLTAVDTSRVGPVAAVVTQNVHDTVSGRYLLIPQGARLLGRTEGRSSHGDRRAFLVWERLILPNGKSLVLDDEVGVDAQGAVGVRGEVDRRLLPLLAATLFAGAITALGQVARDDDDGGGLIGDAGDAAAIQGAQTGGRLVDRELEVRPTIRLRPGAPVRVLVTRDLVLEPYRP